MSRILVLGYELPSLARASVEARSYRTWQFVETLLDDGHDVCLVISDQEDEPDVSQSISERLKYHRLNMRRRGWLKKLQGIHDSAEPVGIAAVMFNSCLRATRIHTNAPVWMDLYGDRLAETQLAEHAAGSSRGHGNIMRYMHEVLLGGDVFSTCGTPQKHALIGQLAMLSRLTRHVLGYEFVYPILPGAKLRPKDHSQDPSLRGNLVPSDAIVVLWCGGYNVWTDAETLFRAIEGAMERDSRIVYVSVGGAAGGGGNNSYDRFLRLIEHSPHRGRYVMQGWQPANLIPAYYAQADVGVSLDAFHYEMVLGTRTRLIEMLSYGLPVITTLGCELSTVVQSEGLGMTFPIGDADAFRDRILAMAGDESLRTMAAKRAESYVGDQLSVATTTYPFRNWAKKPYHAPDRISEKRINVREFEYGLRTFARGIMWRLWSLESGE